MSQIDLYFQVFFTAINWSAMQLMAVTLFVFAMFGFLVRAIEIAIVGKALGVQLYDILMIVLFILAFGFSMYKLGELKQVVSHITWHNTQGQAKDPEIKKPQI